METVDTVVIGAGVIGLAVARALAQASHEVLILEAQERFGTQTSSRNSEVIHAGLYYPPGSLKARLCVAGREQLYHYCAERGIAHRQIGKLLVACDAEELPGLAHYAERAAANGVPLQPLTAAEIHPLEPAVHALAGLYSPTTGILDSHGFMLALLGDAEQAGALLVVRTPVIGGHITSRGILLETGGDAPFTVQSRRVVNAAGLFAPDVARRIAGFPVAAIPPAFYAKGHYFTLSGRAPFQHLVYPMPDHAGLGIHATLDLGGQCKFGPDVSGWSETPDYAFETGLEVKFYQAIRRYYPDLPAGALQPGYVGIRPKISGPAEAAADFCIQGPAAHGVPGWVNLFGIESPGLTATLAIAREVAQQLGVIHAFAHTQR